MTQTHLRKRNNFTKTWCLMGLSAAWKHKDVSQSAKTFQRAKHSLKGKWGLPGYTPHTTPQNLSCPFFFFFFFLYVSWTLKAHLKGLWLKLRKIHNRDRKLHWDIHQGLSCPNLYLKYCVFQDISVFWCVITLRAKVHKTINQSTRLSQTKVIMQTAALKLNRSFNVRLTCVRQTTRRCGWNSPCEDVTYVHEVLAPQQLPAVMAAGRCPACAFQNLEHHNQHWAAPCRWVCLSVGTLTPLPLLPLLQHSGSRHCKTLRTKRCHVQLSLILSNSRVTGCTMISPQRPHSVEQLCGNWPHTGWNNAGTP